MLLPCDLVQELHNVVTACIDLLLKCLSLYVQGVLGVHLLTHHLLACLPFSVNSGKVGLYGQKKDENDRKGGEG